jgi:hypothetical protein
LGPEIGNRNNPTNIIPVSGLHLETNFQAGIANPLYRDELMQSYTPRTHEAREKLKTFVLRT